ncbi:MAG TPA: beta-ketoacyl-[acyl-carrier-protein] synthase family protein [Ktedonobacteraceae bacterium]|nr:beta-ketoacyl-[acyl-carrier-protein] synthase family protein [Ktedonobacteraceae bacterium]
MSKVPSPPLRRVVITGLGVVAPNGIGKEQFWHACLSGRSGINHITRFDSSPLPSQIAGEVANFAPEQFGVTADETLHMDRATQFALAAANLALQDADLDNHALSAEEREHIGVYMGLAMACLEEGEKQWAQSTGNGRYEPDASQNDTIPATLLMSHASASAIAAHHQLYGPCTVIATGCSAGADAIGQAFWLIQEGRADRMLAGGTDAAICYGVLDVFCVMGALSSNYNNEPERASRPYDHKRDGFVMAEGAGVVLLEEREHALARGAHIYAEIVAFSSNSNAYHMTSLPPDGTPLQNLLLQALAEANITADELAYINSHGSSTPPNEVAETAAYKAVFGERAHHIPISATKSMIGHTQGAASAIETIITALVLEQQILPPTINQDHPDPHCDLDYVPNVAREAAVNVALTHSSGFGGVNSVLVLAQPNWTRQWQ